MSPNSRTRLIMPILIIVVGVGWLLSDEGICPDINWVWTLGLGVIGILTVVVSKGFDKASVVIGPSFLLASLLSMLRQTGRMSLDIEVPILVIGIGALSLLAQLPAIPTPGWLIAQPPTEEAGTSSQTNPGDQAHGKTGLL